MVQPQHLHMVPFIIVNIMIMMTLMMMMMIIIIIWKGYSSVTPILSFCSFESKKKCCCPFDHSSQTYLSSKPDLNN